jgi:hypothetical protein
MATYSVYIDYGDCGQEATIEASCIASAIRKIAPTRSHGCEYTIRLNGQHVATMTVSQFGNPTIEILSRVEYSPHVAYATQVWDEYFLNGLDELCLAYRQPHED